QPRAAWLSLLVWLCISFALFVAVGGGLRVFATPAAVATAPAPHQFPPLPTSVPRFRVGNAGQPFGSSTVSGDFNHDGRPDVAIADHTARRTNGYGYNLEFSVSGQPPQSVTFETVHEALTLSVADVDHDDDDDIVVSVPLSGEPVGVWLNDGHGRF